MTATSVILNVSACSVCFFAPSDAVSGVISGRTISSQATGTTGGIGRYVLSGAATTAASGAVKAGTPGATLYQPLLAPDGSSNGVPPVSTLPADGTRIAVFSGTGALDVNTTAYALLDANSVTKSFTVSSAPTTALDNATTCGGTCAFFDSPSSTSATTEFIVTRSGGTTQWGGGFTCLRGVDKSKITAVTDISSITSSSWSEQITSP
jgi:hypothetical protein